MRDDGGLPVGILLGLAFVEKMAAVMVLLPLLLWLLVGHLPRTFGAAGARSDWIDGVAHDRRDADSAGSGFPADPDACNGGSRRPSMADLFNHRPTSDWPGAILAIPLGLWLHPAPAGTALAQASSLGR